MSSTVVIGIVVCVLVVSYLLYCSELSKCCKLIGESSKMCWVPYLNKFKLVSIEDVDLTKRIELPFVGFSIRREILAVGMIAAPFLATGNQILTVAGMVLLFVSNFCVWNEISCEFEESASLSLFYSFMCSLLGLHFFQWLRLYQLRVVLENSGFACEEAEEESPEEESVPQTFYEEEEDEGEELDEDYFDKLFESQ